MIEITKKEYEQLLEIKRRYDKIMETQKRWRDKNKVKLAKRRMDFYYREKAKRDER